MMLKALLSLLIVAASLDLRLGFPPVQGQVTDLSDHLDANEDDDYNIADDTGKADVTCILPERGDKILSVSDESLRPGTVLTFACENGLELIGTARETCKEDGKWHSEGEYEPTICAGPPYYGPFEKIYSYEQCQDLKWTRLTGGPYITSRHCAKYCDMHPPCNSFNIKDNECYFFGCPSPQPKPMNLSTGWDSYSKEEIHATYHGPYKNIYNLRQCVNTATISYGNGMYETRLVCEMMCDDDPRCTAFNIKDRQCQLMQCGSPQPKPMSFSPGWESYSKDEIPESSTGEVTDAQLKEEIESYKSYEDTEWCKKLDTGLPC